MAGCISLPELRCFERSFPFYRIDDLISCNLETLIMRNGNPGNLILTSRYVLS